MTIRGLLGILALICMAVCSGPLTAAETPESCGMPQLRNAFGNYTQVGRGALQCQLNQWGYKIRIDNRMGSETYSALQEFCRSQGVTETGEAMAGTLVELLYSLPERSCDVATPAAVQVPARSATPIVYRLGEQDFTELAARGDVIQQLETLKDVPFLTERALKSEVETALAEVTKLAEQFAAAALAAAQQLDSLRLTQGSFNRLRLANLPESALELLQTLQDLPFADAVALRKAVVMRLTPESPPADNTQANEQSASEAAGAAPAATDYRQYAVRIVAQADQVRVYQLTEQSFEVLKARPEFQVIPSTMLDRLGKIQNMGTIDQRLFTQAVDGTLEIVYRHYLSMILEAAGDAARISAQVLENLKGNGLPDDILAVLSPLQDKPYIDSAALETELQALLQEPLMDFKEKGYPQLLVQQGRQVIPDALGEPPIRWDGGSCGCSRELSALVYGFYPFWLVDRVEAPEGDAYAEAGQPVDFSALTRIGYYGVYLDEKGEIDNLRQWSSAGNPSFVEQAGKYRTYLDLVVYTDAWDAWGALSEDEMSQAAKAVAAKLNLPLAPGFGDRLKALLPFVADKPETMGDGVTLYFQDVANPTKADARKQIVSFIQKLHQELSLLDKSLSLNIMFEPGPEPVGGQESFLEVLAAQPDLLGIQESGDGLIDLLLVLLAEPTTDTKKSLRSEIEDTFKGKDRRTVLRKILPVISPVGQDKDPNGAYVQFTDDLIYFEDNFRGVGLWPLPLPQDVDVQAISRLIKENFKPQEQQDFLQRMVAQYVPQLCDYACPNRWQFRLAFDVLLILLLASGAVVWVNCRLRERVKTNPWPLLALAAALILVFGISLVCDPFWNQRSDDVALGLLGVVLVVIVGRYFLKMNRGKLP